jgi:D-3-phosphoglycerate dehydrogenase / 2-oxoglutarate reductase
VEETIRDAHGDYESLITITIVTDRQERSIAGTVFADGVPRVVAIKGIKVDAAFAPSMLYVSNEDKPGFIGKFASVLGEAGVNIATFALGRDAQGGSAIALVEIDGAAPESMLDAVQAIAGVKQVRTLRFA